MTRKFFVLLAGSLLLLSGSVLADSAPFAANLDNTAEQAEGVFLRYFEPTFADFGPLNCAQGFDGIYCTANYKSKNNGYKGDSDNIFNYGDKDEGTVMHGVWDHQKGAGTAEHQGFYAWVCGPVNNGESHQWFDPGCPSPGNVGTSCIGNSGPDVSLGQPDTPQGAISPADGLSVIPVPQVLEGVSPTDELVDLDWDEVTAIGCGNAAGYRLFYYVDDLTDGTCDLPSEAQFLETTLGLLDTPSAQVNVSTDLGSDSFNPGEGKGVVFALQLDYGKTAGDAATSRYLSANSWCISFDTGLAVEIYDLQVRYAGRNNTEVSWKTSAEDGVRGFYVTRATTLDGSYERVSSLIPAKGEPSAYSFIDTITPQRGRIVASGLYYKIESVDIDDNVQVFGPVSLERPSQAPVRVQGPMRRR